MSERPSRPFQTRPASFASLSERLRSRKNKQNQPTTKKKSQTSLCVCSQTCRAIQFGRIKVVVLKGDRRAAGFKPTSNLMHGEFQLRWLAAAQLLTPRPLLTNAATQRPPLRQAGAERADTDGAR